MKRRPLIFAALLVLVYLAGLAIFHVIGAGQTEGAPLAPTGDLRA